MITIYNIRPKGFNVGNDAIYVAMQMYLYEAFGGLVNLITLPATSRYESQSVSGLTSKTIHEINRYAHGVIVGGGNLYENGELDVDVNALNALDVPMMLFSISRGRIFNRNDKLVDRTDVMPDSLISALHKRADYSLARDKATFDHIKGLGCDVELGGCPTIFLDRLGSHFPNIDRISGQYENTVLVSIRNPDLINVSIKNQVAVADHVKSIVVWLRETQSVDVKLLCHDIRDIAFAVSLGVADYIYTGDVFSYLSIIRKCAGLVSYRLHSFLPAVSFGRPAVKISYDERAISLVDTLGLGDWNINMVESSNVVGEVIERYENMDRLESSKAEAQSKWEHLDSVMCNNFDSFAKDVQAVYKN